MDNFNLRKYLAEGKLKENFEFTENDIDEMNETAFMAGWNLGQKGVVKDLYTVVLNQLLEYGIQIQWKT